MQQYVTENDSNPIVVERINDSRKAFGRDETPSIIQYTIKTASTKRHSYNKEKHYRRAPLSQN